MNEAHRLKSLKKLTLINMSITNDGLLYLGHAIIESSTFEDLNLANNKLTTKGVTQFLYLILPHNNLKSLNISYNVMCEPYHFSD